MASMDDTSGPEPQTLLEFLSDIIDAFFTRIEILEGDFTDYQDAEDIANTIMAVTCVICAGLAAGLTMGLLSLDCTKLEIKQMTGSEEEQLAASRLLPIVKQHHLLLVTLLLFNSIANEALPIFLGALVPNYLAVIMAVVLILFFGEIIPSAFFTGPQQLITASRMASFVWGLMFFFAPIAWPIAKALDFAFGSDDANRDGKISREDLGALMILQTRQRQLSTENAETRYQESESEPFPAYDGLHQYEVNILTGILSLSRISVGDCMIEITNVYSLESHVSVTAPMLRNILASGFSRIPIYKTFSMGHTEQSCIWLGYLLTKSLIGVDLTQVSGAPNTFGSQPLREPLFVRPNLGLLEMLAMFREGRCHLAMVSKTPMDSLEQMRNGLPCDGDSAILGIVTLEDVIERILQTDIIDETDVVSSDLVPNSSFKSSGAPTVMFYGFHKSKTTPERDPTKIRENNAKARTLAARYSRESIENDPLGRVGDAAVSLELETSTLISSNESRTWMSYLNSTMKLWR